MNEEESASQKLVKKDCGIHWGMTSGPCRKCGANANVSAKHRAGLQYGGTPWAAVLGDEAPKDAPKMPMPNASKKSMKMKKSQLKEAVKAIVRQTLSERLNAEGIESPASEMQPLMQKIVDLVSSKVPSCRNNPEKLAQIAAQLYEKQTGEQADPAIFKKLVGAQQGDATEAEMTSEAKPFGDETEEPEASSMGDEEIPDINGDEMGGEEPVVGMGDSDGDNDDSQPALGGDEAPGLDTTIGEDEQMEIKLIKLMRLCASKLEAMHKGMPGDESPVSLPPEVEEPSTDEEPDVPFKNPADADNDSDTDVVPFEKSDSEPDNDSDDKPDKKEPKSDTDKSDSEPKKGKKGKKEKKSKKGDPTEFTKKLAKECSYKVQKRSYRTSSDTPYADPNNVQDPEIPGT